MKNPTVALGADHAGYALKDSLAEEIAQLGFSVLDLGTSGPLSVDYPDFAQAVAEAIGDGRATFGLVVCGSGIGISIAANRYHHIRAALCSEPLSARLARQHNDANVLALGARLIGPDLARECLKVFLETPFDGGRHTRRVAKLKAPVSVVVSAGQPSHQDT